MVLALHFSAAATEWFPFNTVNHKWNISVNGGYSPSGRVAVYGLGATVRGFHLTIGGLVRLMKTTLALTLGTRMHPLCSSSVTRFQSLNHCASLQLSGLPAWGKCRQMDMIGSCHTMHSEI